MIETPLFKSLAMTQLTLLNFDEDLEAHEKDLVGVFFWGHDCPNCEVAKRILEENKSEILNLKIKWFHVNTYEDLDLGTRFGLHGIPTFIFFQNGKRLGKISPFPGIKPFVEALQKLSVKSEAGAHDQK